MDRSKQIKKVSYTNIASNVVLVGFKAAVGLISGSIAIILDAVNNLTDALSSLITVVAVSLSGKRPDEKHPFGYGRIEYLSAVVISALVLFAGITSAIEAAKRIAAPEPATYSLTTIVIVALALVAKLVLGFYTKKKGKSLDSDSLVASGVESVADAGVCASTLVAIAVYSIWGVSIEGYVGVIIAALIIKAGVELLMGAVGDILGRRAHGELAAQVKSVVGEVEGVLGVYDLVLHDYGPSRAMGSVHVEVDSRYSANDIHRIIKAVQVAVLQRFHIVMTVSVYSCEMTDGDIIKTREFVRSVALSQKGVKGMHGFFIDGSRMSFDIVVDFDCDVRSAVRSIKESIADAMPDMDVCIVIDKDYIERV